MNINGVRGVIKRQRTGWLKKTTYPEMNINAHLVETTLYNVDIVKIWRHSSPPNQKMMVFSVQ